MQDILRLWGDNRKTLGLFPAGAFADCAARGHLIAAHTPEDIFAGYLSFRVPRRLNSAAIIHLCVTPAARRTGCSDQLVEWLKQYGKELQLAGLRLKCRRDYHAEKLWQRTGFVARADVRGRGSDGAEVTVWIHNLGEPDLFSGLAGDEDDRVTAVLDANIFYDLHGVGGTRSEESLVLREPWVDDAVRFAVVEEIHNEINRCKDPAQREAYHQLAHSYPELTADSTLRTKNESQLLNILSFARGNASEHSDCKQLAGAGAAGADVFVTRDGDLLAAREEIEAQLGIRVQRPTELSGNLDETERSLAYQPLRLAATSLTFGPMRASDVEAIAEAMLACESGEKRSALCAQLRSYLAKVRSTPRHEIGIVRDGDHRAVALLVRADEDGLTRVPVIRVSRKHSLARTITRHLLLMCIQDNAVGARSRLVICDPQLSVTTAEALRELHFSSATEGWIRVTPAWSGDRAGLLKSFGTEIERFAEMSAAQLEERLWPAKIIGEGLPSYVIAVDPTWAAQLFDARLAATELFGAFDRLALNRENVYYRSGRPAGLLAPARILWYVTKDASVPGTMALRACSRLVRVEIGSAKKLYKHYRSLGIYQWREVLKTAGGDPDSPVMVLRFADTEQFASPVDVAAVRRLGITSTFQSPSRIEEWQFQQIYDLGRKLPAA